MLEKRLVTAACLIYAWIALSHGVVLGQSGLGGVRGRVTDPSGRSVPGANVALSGPGLVSQATQSDIQGQFQFRNVAPGIYAVSVSAKGLAPYRVERCEVIPGSTRALEIPLVLAASSEQITVKDAPRLDLDPSSNAGAVILRGKELEALADDPDELAADLVALAGPAAGPNGGQIYINGFTGGRLPPKSSIREVRINQSPFSAQFDRLGYGRVEIFTKPGTEDLHGELLFQYGNDYFNARNPFAPVKPPYERRQWEGEISAPLRKKTSISGDFEIRRITEDAFINALTLDQNLQVLPVTTALVTPLSGTEENIQVDRQITPNHTFSLSYMYARDTRKNQGVGGFSLASRAYDNRDGEDEIVARETGVFGARMINETQARYRRLRSRQSGEAGLPTISVMDAFTGGGPPLQLSFSNQHHFEGQNVTTFSRGPHAFRWGGRLRGVSLKDQDTQNYTGSYTFSSLDSYRLTLLGLQNGLAPARIRASGGGASQFSLAGGNPLSALNQVDVGVFFQDDWRLRSNLTVSLGMRYEGQTNLADGRDIAPRLGVAWGVGRKAGTLKTILRAGVGVFYDRVSESLALDAIRRDGVHQQQFVVDSPDFYPLIPSLAQLAGNREPQAIRKVDARMRAPQLFQSAFGVERQLPKNIVLTTNYVHTHGLHSLRSRNINAPLPGGGSPPYGPINAIYLYEASGSFKQDQLIAGVNARVSPKLTITGSYTLNKAMSDTDGAGSFPADPYNLRPEYGRAGFDVRHRVQLNGSIEAPWGLRLSPLLTVTSGRPFNVTLGRDLNGDTLFTDRPAFATDPSRASVVRTAFGAFDLTPQAGQAIIPHNHGQGPGQFGMNLRLTKTIEIGAESKASKNQSGGKDSGRDPRELIFSISARNLLNHSNLANPVGNLSSPLFGRSVALAGGAAGSRRLDLQVRFSF